MQGWIAYKFGDTTPLAAGRLTFNPIKHIDLFGTIIVPAVFFVVPQLMGIQNTFLFGWTKPMPINWDTLIEKGGYKAAMEVSVSGVVFHLIAAGFFSVIVGALDVPTNQDDLLSVLLYVFIFQSVIINVVLAVFNLLPIPPFPGGQFLFFLSLRLQLQTLANFFIRIEPYGMFIIIIIIISPLRNFLIFEPVMFMLKHLI